MLGFGNPVLFARKFRHPCGGAARNVTPHLVRYRFPVLRWCRLLGICVEEVASFCFMTPDQLIELKSKDGLQNSSLSNAFVTRSRKSHARNTKFQYLESES